MKNAFDLQTHQANEKNLLCRSAFGVQRVQKSRDIDWEICDQEMRWKFRSTELGIELKLIEYEHVLNRRFLQDTQFDSCVEDVLLEACSTITIREHLHIIHERTDQKC
jgi:hypothetical protein